MLPTSPVFQTSGTPGNEQIANVRGDFINSLPPMNEKQDERIFRWLAAPDSSSNFREAREAHLAQTGDWLIDGEQFANWKQTPNSALWVYGAPGSGKTVICSTVIDNILGDCAGSPAVACAYFFLDNRTAQSDLSSHDKMLRSLVEQLSRQSTGLPAALIEMYGDGHQQPSVASLQIALQRLIEGFEQTYIVIDGLDECIDREKLITWIGDLLQRNTCKLHALLSSRPEHDIESSFKNIAHLVRVPLVGKAVDADINRYLDAVLAKLTKWDAPIRNRVKDALVRDAQGTFRWGALQAAELITCCSRRAVDLQLEAMPRDLAGTYERYITQSPVPDHLRQFLVWLAFSKCELKIGELADAVTVDFLTGGLPTYDQDLRYFAHADMLEMCAGFITTTKYGTVKLAHTSIKDFLLSNNIKVEESEFGFTHSLAQAVVAQTCLAYIINLESFPISDLPNQNLPLASYAANHWIDHMILAHEDHDGSVAWTLMTDLFSFKKGTSATWVQLAGFSTALQVASFHGHQAIVQVLLEMGEDVNDSGEVVGSALQAASSQGHETIVRFLLDKGAEVNATGGAYGSALQAASAGGHVETVRLLLERGADANLRGGLFGSALLAAKSINHDTVIKILLEKGAAVEEVDDIVM